MSQINEIEAANFQIESDWIKNPIKIDGEITNTTEWADATAYKIILGLNQGKSPPYLESWIWTKNDNDNLYLLIRVEYIFKITPDVEDPFLVYYLWSQDPSTAWDTSDAAKIHQMGSPTDLCLYDGTDWVDDTFATPPGTNNVNGLGYYDSIFYWFEATKSLNLGDGRDWSLAPGDTIGLGNTPQNSDLLYMGLYDDDKNEIYETRITLKLAEPPQETRQPVGGELTNKNMGPLVAQITLGTLISLFALVLVYRINH
ncbi:MAG: hypothetical protein NWE89_01990 [Candidatus Bathyarchaeota archaeon]|nr:hypothetical protein [Candidatus Bathyarchaeota archaeon]